MRKNKSREETVVDVAPVNTPVDEIETDQPATAVQHHTVVTKYQTEVPLAQVNGQAEELSALEEEAIAPSDSIARMLAELGATENTHSWTMVIERLPRYEKDRRRDVNTERINCGTRPVTPDWEEDIRREFARPGKANHFRVAFKRDGIIFAHLPYVLSLEPPAPEVIAEQETRIQNAMTPSAALPGTVKPPSLKEQLSVLKELAEIRDLLSPVTEQPQPPPPQPLLTTESAVVHLLTQSPDAMGQLTEKLFGRLIGGNASASADSEPSLAMIAYEAVRQGTLPAIARELAGIFRPMLQQPGPSFTAAAPPVIAPPPIAPPAPDPQSARPAQQSPEEFLLAQILDACAVNLPTHLAANGIWAIVDAPQNALYQLQLMAALRQLSEMPAEMLLPMAQSIRPEIERAPHAAQWLADVQQRIKTDLESEANGDTDDGA